MNESSPSLLSRRHFSSNDTIPGGSQISLLMPYFTVDEIRWLDANTDDRSLNVHNGAHEDVVTSDVGIRRIGLTSIVRDKPWPKWELGTTVNATIVKSTKFIAVKMDTLEYCGARSPDIGQVLTNLGETCQSRNKYFGSLPFVAQHDFTWSVGEKTCADDCFLVGEAIITAGVFFGQNCKVDTALKIGDYFATCPHPNVSAAIQAHELAELSVDFISQVLKYTSVLDYTRPSAGSNSYNSNIDTYVKGLLAAGYHGAWSGLMNLIQMAESSAVDVVSGAVPVIPPERLPFTPAIPVIVASVDRDSLYIWLTVNASLLLSAIMVMTGQSISNVKTIRDTALTALTMNISEVAHSPNARPGLCNAVALRSEDKKLGMLRWKTEGGGVCRKIVLASEHATGVELQKYEPYGSRASIR